MDLYHGKYDIIIVPIVVLYDFDIDGYTDIERITQISLLLSRARSRSNNCQFKYCLMCAELVYAFHNHDYYYHLQSHYNLTIR